MIIVIGGQKGGGGKSTVATHLAVLRHKKDGDVLLVDADPQSSASKWGCVRDANKLKPRISTVQKTGNNTYEDLAALKGKYRNIIIDTPGADTIEHRAGLLIADVAVVPLFPFQYDIWELSPLIALIEEIKIVNPSIKILVCMNRAPATPGVKEIEQAKEMFSDIMFRHMRSANTILYNRLIYPRTVPYGKIVHEAKTDPKAENEMDSLYQEVFHG